MDNENQNNDNAPRKYSRLLGLVKDNPNFMTFLAVVFLVIFIALVTSGRISKRHAEDVNELLTRFERVYGLANGDRQSENEVTNGMIEVLHLDSLQSATLKSLMRELDEKHKCTQQEYKINVEEMRLLLDSQVVKIQNEYEALQIWCGLLTIVFLVFSFYSMFKADNIVRQGNEALSDISKIKKEGRDSVDDITVKVNEQIKKFIDGTEVTIAKERDSAINDLQSYLAKTNSDIETSYKNYVERIIREFSEKFGLEKQSIESDMKTFAGKMLKLKMDIDTVFRESESRMKTIEDKLPLLEVMNNWADLMKRMEDIMKNKKDEQL